ncbi:hypothetical protein HY496_01485 [Candidatus Woesearchaeota archaeon]|nr:hypothetical protein [Candidatus Woesearchaeota archaeon]
MSYEERVLKELASQTFAERHNDRMRGREQTKKAEEVSKQPDAIRHTFYCTYCRKDFLGIGAKRTAENRAWYGTRHECGKESIRRITYRTEDEYYDLSEEIRLQRQIHSDDTLAPFDNRFRQVYGQTRDEAQSETEQNEHEQAVLSKFIGMESSRPRGVNNDA